MWECGIVINVEMGDLSFPHFVINHFISTFPTFSHLFFPFAMVLTGLTELTFAAGI